MHRRGDIGVRRTNRQVPWCVYFSMYNSALNTKQCTSRLVGDIKGYEGSHIFLPIHVACLSAVLNFRAPAAYVD